MEPIRRLAQVEVADLIKWLDAIPNGTWADADRMTPRSPYPALVSSLDWRGFGEVFDPLVRELMQRWPGRASDNWRLCMIVPGQHIPEHTDPMSPQHVTRVHVPLRSNRGCWMRYGDYLKTLEVGWAWEVEPELPHSIGNDGTTDRVHFFFDVFD